MKNILSFVLLFVILSSCEYRSGSGDLVKSSRNVETFTSVRASGGMEVHITPGATAKVVVEADDNVIEDVETTVRNGQLNISLEDGVNYNNVTVKVFITAPGLNKINGSASAEIIVAGILESPGRIELNASSGSSIKAQVDAPEADVDASSGAEVNLTGKTRALDVHASSGAAINAFDLLSENTAADASSGAKVDTHASIKLDAKASSGGSISYRGPAATVIQESSGGSIKKSN